MVAYVGIEANILPGYTSAWVGDEKLGEIGVRVSHGVPFHRFALNVTPDLSCFNTIVPCGISNRGVTSLARLLSRHIPVRTEAFAEVFDSELRWRKSMPSPDRVDKGDDVFISHEWRKQTKKLRASLLRVQW